MNRHLLEGFERRGGSGLWVEERQSKILNLLKRDKRVEADRLALDFKVSRETIRRDLKILEERGLIQRTHGGALMNEQSKETPFEERRVSRIAEKRALCQAAVSLMVPGGSHFIDAGSTTAILGEFMGDLPEMSIVTNAVELAMTVRKVNPAIDVVLLGGTIASDVPATFGEMALRQLRNFHADVALVSPVGIDPSVGVSYYDLAEAELAGQMLENARQKVVIADASKCGVVSRAIVSECKHIDVLVTDEPETSAYADAGLRRVIHAAA